MRYSTDCRSDVRLRSEGQLYDSMTKGSSDWSLFTFTSPRHSRSRDQTRTFIVERHGDCPGYVDPVTFDARIPHV